jgi:hypothetical protein
MLAGRWQLVCQQSGGIFDPILSDFEKSEETALEKCLSFTELRRGLKIHSHAVAVQLIQCATTWLSCLHDIVIFPLIPQYSEN